MDEDAVLDELFNDDSIVHSEAEGDDSPVKEDGRKTARVSSARTLDSDSEATDTDEGSKKQSARKGRRRGLAKDATSKNSAMEEQSPTTGDGKIMEARRDFEEALLKLKTGRRRRDADSESVNYDEIAVEFTNKMLEAVKKDDEAAAAETPALTKLKMINEVSEMLTKKHMQEVLLDNQVLDCIKKWLEPNIRGHLAVHSVRKRLLELLQLLPIETAHLRESGIGKIVMFYYQRRSEALDIRKLSGDLISTWSRPIIGASLDYREVIYRSPGDPGIRETEDGPSGGSVTKVIQSERFKSMVRSGALDREGGQDARLRRLGSTLHRQKSRKTGGSGAGDF